MGAGLGLGLGCEWGRGWRGVGFRVLLMGSVGSLLGDIGGGMRVVVIQILIDAVTIQKLEKHTYVFEACVHSLPVKRDHGVRGIA